MTGMEQGPELVAEKPDQIIGLRGAQANDYAVCNGDFLKGDQVTSPEDDYKAVGVKYLKEKYGHDINAQATNYAAAILVTLKHNDAAMLTGKSSQDVSVLGVPSQELLQDVLLTFPLGISISNPAGDLIFEEFSKNIGTANPEGLTGLIVDFLRGTNDYQYYLNDRTDIENKAIRDNLRPALFELRYLTERFVDTALQNYVLPSEGGDQALFEPELLYELCEPNYLRVAFNGDPGGKCRFGIRGENIIRLMNEARALGIPGANISLQ